MNQLFFIFSYIVEDKLDIQIKSSTLSHFCVMLKKVNFVH